MTLLTEMKTDDSWVDSMVMEKPNDHVGHRVLDAVRDTGEWPTQFIRAVKYQPRKSSAAYNRAVMYQRLSKLVRFAYIAVLVFCGMAPTVLAATQQSPHYLLWTIGCVSIPALFVLENALFKRGDIGRHTTIVNADSRVRLYDQTRSMPAIERGPIRRELEA